MEAMTLEPCPFCGGKPIPGWGMCHEVQLFNVRCRCGAGVNDFSIEDEAAKAWNRRAHLAQPAQAVDVGADEWVEALAMPEGYELDEHLPGIWEYEYDREDGERMASATSWNHPALAAIAAWQEYTRALSGEKAGPVGDGWQPIETAKEDDPPALVSDGKHTAIAHIIGGKWVQFVSGVPMLFQPMLEWKPTHWQPLPASPTPGKEGEG